MPAHRPLLSFTLLACAGALAAADGRLTTDLSGNGWRLWLDEQATWQNDELFAPPVDLAKVPVHPPTGGWRRLDAATGIAVSVPTTVEAHLHRTHRGGDGDIQGVSWWYRDLTIPADATGRRLELRFGAVRQRAEVYLDERLVGYDLVGNTPFTVDLTGIATPGHTHRLAVRVTDPGGNFDWRDFVPLAWGKYSIPMSHGFGGILDRVELAALNPVHIADVYVQNQPDPTAVVVQVTVRNAGSAPASPVIAVVLRDRADGKEVARQTVPAHAIAAGDTVLTARFQVPNAKLWDLDHPNLYTCTATVTQSGHEQDADQRTFGFRWFAPDITNDRAVLRLNGQRVFVRTAISWGYWPLNGIIPTGEQADRQIATAKALGLNMLNFHRGLGQPLVLDRADAAGLLYFEEPGGHVSAQGDAFARILANEKLKRMVRRDRSHPSLVIYNLINEQHPKPDTVEHQLQVERELHDLRDAHALDPSRVFTYASAWADKPDAPELPKAHLRPFDGTLHFTGWYDNHRAGGPMTWQEDFYRTPSEHYGFIKNPREIVYWGEEGALSAPPRLEKIRDELKGVANPGWSGQAYRNWFATTDDFLTRKNLRSVFPTVDAWTTALGAVSLGHQGRKIEDTRICDDNDGYAVNGWESEIHDNHSGIVDEFHFAKADPALMAQYCQPFRVAVKPRAQVVQIPDAVTVDFYALNEIDRRGPHTLRLRVQDANGRILATSDKRVTLSGGDTFGQLLAEAERIDVRDATGLITITGDLIDDRGTVVATGHDQILAVDWRSPAITGRGAVWESNHAVQNFLAKDKQTPATTYRDDLGQLDWVVATAAPAPRLAVVPLANVLNNDGKPGLTATYVLGQNLAATPVLVRGERLIDLSRPTGAPPNPAVPTIQDFSIRWTGVIVPPVSGTYRLAVTAGDDDCAALWLDGQPAVTVPDGAGSAIATWTFTAGKPVSLRFDYHQRSNDILARLEWQLPADPTAPDAERLLARVHDQGTTLIVLDQADAWAERLAAHQVLTYHGAFAIGENWLGGLCFAKRHALFADLPTDQALDWPYQAVVRDGAKRLALRLDGEELVAGGWHSYPYDLGTTVGVVPYGKGRVVLSALDIVGNLAWPNPMLNAAQRLAAGNLSPASDPQGNAAHTARKLLVNYLRFANTPR
jgi:hypothetical protein